MLTALWCETHMNAARISRNLLVLGRSLPSSRVLTQNSRFMPQMCARSNPFYSGTRSLSSFRNTLRPMRKELTQLTPIRHLAKKSGEVKVEKLDMPSPKFTEATAKETPKVSDWKYAVRLIKLAKPEAKLIAGAIGFLFVSSAITMSVPFSMGKIIDIATKSSNIPLNLELPQFFLLLGGVFTCGALANIGRILMIRIAGERVIARLRTNLYDAILKKDMTFFDANRSGDLISRLSLDTAIVGKTISNNVSDGLRSIITATAGLTTMAYVSGKLTLTMMVIVPPIALGGVFYGRYVKDLSRKTQDALGAITKVAEERIGNIRTVHAFVRESDEVKRYELRVQDVFDLAKKEAMANGIFFGGTGLAGNLTILALLGLGGRMVMEGSITVGQLTSFMLYTAYVGSSLMGLTNFYSELMKGIGASTRLFELIDEKPKISLEGGKVLDDIRGEITFQNVQFAYPTRPGNEIFKDLTFTVEPGKMLAITGSSGGGKSTVSSLLLRYYDPLQGSILIDGHDIRSLNLRWLRNQIGIVSQEPTLFAGTIGENIAYGKKGATREEIEEAARQANCNFIENFKDGFNTYVGERGISLSGGQKQRIAIARALLKNPRILILDEATSALDGESEYLVQEALDRLTLNRTTLTIAHRISTIRISDVVICLHGGKVHEQGSFYELSQREDGIFRKLMERQMLNNSNS